MKRGRRVVLELRRHDDGWTRLGETDVETSIDDANAPASKRHVKVTRLPRTNHMCKEVAERVRASPTLTDPTAPGVVDAIATGVKR